MTAALPPAFTRLWTASAISSTGDGIYFAALPLLASTLTGDPVTVSLVSGAVLLPWPLLGLVGGALVDRWDRRRTMWIADVARAVLLLTLFAAGTTGVLSVPSLIAMAFLLGVGQLFFDTAAQAFLPALLDRDRGRLQLANTRLRGVQLATDGFLGPPAGSALFALSRMVPFLADAASFALSAVLIRSLPATPVKPREVRTSLWADAKEGASYLFRTRLLLGLSLRPAVGNLAFGAGNAVMVLFVREELHLGAAGYGVFLACEGVGGLLGTFLAGRVDRLFGTGRALTVTAVVEAGAVLALGLARNPVWAGVAFAVCACGMAATMVLGVSLRQAIVPDQLMGRVSAASRLLALSAGPIGAVSGGVLATAAGLRAPYFAGAGVLLSMTLVTASMTSNRKVDAALAEAKLTHAPQHCP
ncbi:MFS transporter [Amycolatopsis sp. H20-H5]|uniref:MFS transporter n=1 Tax=Amycolatopsis sp. H20-H5 TaxID=3046309 RepID=UPI002DB98D12|nr:MFS transporter [Amycolatopsis sp. H20-H5]MEC3979099.1 MFS transporter [Amycolatopsis sp. H20-H5]